MRQTIRLTESELRRAIGSTLRNTRQRTTRGVVNEVLSRLCEASGLDWKTLANAESKRRRQADAAYNAHNYGDSYAFGEPYWELDKKANELQDAAKKAFERDYKPKNKHVTWFDNGDCMYDEDDPEAKKILDKMQKELDDYDSGNYEYVKGKGWQLKNESRRRRGRMLR